MKRETIEFTEYEIAPILNEYALENEEYNDIINEDGDIIGEHPFQDFRIIEEEMDDYDLEDGYEVKSVVVQRISDGKYFRGSYYYSPHIGREYNDTTLTEVFPNVMSITVYD